MKLVHLTFHFEFTDEIEAILDRNEIRDAVRIPMVKGRDREGKHEGSQVHPGSVTLIQAQVPDEKIDALLEDLEAFRGARTTHEHLDALVLGVDRSLQGIDGED